MRKHAIKTLVLALMGPLGLMAFMAAGAQAEVKMPIKVLDNSALGAGITGTTLLGRLLVPALKLEIHCEKGTVSGTILTNEVTHAAILFELCSKIFKYNTTTGALETDLSKACLITNGGKEHHITANALFYGLLHKGKLNGIAEGSGVEEAFTEIVFFNECSTVKKAIVKGLYAFEVSQGNEIKLLLTPGNQALQELLSAQMKFGSNPAYLDEGIAHATLTAPHSGCSWGAA
jgi:hypothetical protein